MEYVTLGRTGLRASVIGLGAGGPSRLGLGTGRSDADAVALVRRALDLGVNLIDTAYAYATEAVVGDALAGGRRAAAIVATKRAVAEGGVRLTGPMIAASLEASLERLRTDHVDLFLLHSLHAEDYGYALAEVVPALRRLREAGKVRFLGVSEAFEQDPQHEMLGRALADDWCDAILVGFNILNQSARQRVLPAAATANVGVLGMFAVRRAFSRPDRLRALLAELVRSGQVDPALATEPDPVAALLRDSDAVGLTDAAYRYCRHEPGVHVVLCGTGDTTHLEANVRSALRPPLPLAHQARLAALFGHVGRVTST